MILNAIPSFLSSTTNSRKYLQKGITVVIRFHALWLTCFLACDVQRCWQK